MNQSTPTESVSVRIYSYGKVPDPFPAKQFGKGWLEKPRAGVHKVLDKCFPCSNKNLSSYNTHHGLRSV